MLIMGRGKKWFFGDDSDSTGTLNFDFPKAKIKGKGTLIIKCPTMLCNPVLQLHVHESLPLTHDTQKKI